MANVNKRYFYYSPIASSDINIKNIENDLEDRLNKINKKIEGINL